MVLRYWGERELTAESFSHLADRSKAGIRTIALVAELKRRGWEAAAIEGTDDFMSRELSRGRPVLTLIEDRPGTFHYIVVVAAMPSRAVIFHDPARAPFRVMSKSEFSRRWDAADRWMAVVTPGPTSKGPDAGKTLSPDPPRAPSNSCEQLVADGVRYAQTQDLDGAERTLTTALSCPGSAALRELAGVRALQKRWADATELAQAAVSEDPRDEYAWRLLATSRFIQNEPVAALEAWNRVGEPRVDLVRVDGLRRTRPKVVEQAIGIRPGDEVTPAALTRARRSLRELPSATSTSLEFVPVPSGLAELRAKVSERPLVPSDRWSLARMGLVAAVSRDVKLETGSPTGGGERLGIEWRFWRGRPRVALDAQSPAPWGGVWGAGAFTERQPFDSPSLVTSMRRGARLTIANWAGPWARWSVRGGLDQWKEIGTFSALGGDLTLASSNDRLTGQVEIDSWMGDRPFAVAQILARVRSSGERKGVVLVGTIGTGLASHATPADLWFAGDTGHARSFALRAHPLLDDGRFRVSQLGREAVHASIETQRWWRAQITQMGLAVFVDTVRVGRRWDPSSRSDVDVGGGARLSLPGQNGLLRIDLARGLRDGATALSVVYEH